ncbi:hypothetical protein THAOC_33988, partial [Thalassiosira oceanica]
MKIEVARSAWKVALSRALGQESTERASERPDKAHKASKCRDFATGLGQKQPETGIALGPLRTCRAGQTDEVSEGSRIDWSGRNGTKSSFPESSRRALQVAADRRIQITASPAARGERTKRRKMDDAETSPETVPTRRTRRSKSSRLRLSGLAARRYDNDDNVFPPRREGAGGDPPESSRGGRRAPPPSSPAVPVLPRRPPLRAPSPSSTAALLSHPA